MSRGKCCALSAEDCLLSSFWALSTLFHGRHVVEQPECSYSSPGVRMIFQTM